MSGRPGGAVCSESPGEPQQRPPIRVSIQQPSLPKYRAPLYRRLAQMQEVDVVVYYGSEPGLRNLAPDGFTGHFVPFFTLRLSARNVFYWHWVQWTLASRRMSDVAIFCWNARFLTLLPGILRARWSGVPIALWGHGYSKAGSPLRSLLRAIPAKLADAIILYDFHTAAQWISRGYPRNKIFVAPNGLDSVEIKRAKKSLESDPAVLAEFRKTHGLAAGTVLIYIGRIYVANRLDLAIEALANLKETHPAAKLVVIGDGDQLAELNQLSVRLGVSEQVVWVGPLYDEQKIAPWMSSGDVMIYPSNVGLSLIHGFNYGLPAVVCGDRSSHNPEIWALRHGVNGCIAPEVSARSLADAVRSIVDDPVAHAAMRQAAMDCCDSVYNIDSVCRTFEQLISRLCRIGDSRPLAEGTGP